jgi:transcriptional regulator with XRE-family HTH domain
MTRLSQNARIRASPNPHIAVVVTRQCGAQDARMARRPVKQSANHLRAWREYRRMTQEELASRIGTAGNVIGLLESGERGLSHKWLLKLAPALQTTPGFLLDHDPNDLDTAFLQAAMDVPAEHRTQALAILKTFRTGTDG